MRLRISSLLSFILVFFLALPVQASTQFTDVSDTHWAKEEINYLYDREIIKGFGDNTFRPDQTVTRTHAAIMIVGALELDTDNRPAPTFSDVQEDYYAYDVIATVADEGILQGYNNQFSPDDPLTRGQMAAILQRAFELEGTWGKEFADIAKDYLFYDEIQALASNGITIGYPDNTFQAENDTKRAEFSVFLSRTLDDTFIQDEVEEETDAGELSIHHLDVGQGDSTLIIAPNGSTILVDAGIKSAGQKVVDYLKKAGISSIDRFVITHAHADHVGGAVEVMQNFDVKKVIDSGIPHTTQTYLNYLTYIDENDIPFEVATVGENVGLDPALAIRIVNSGVEGDGLNDSSVALHLTYNEFTYLITGDAEVEGERRISQQPNIKADVLRAGHHGSRTSSNTFFLDVVQPKDVIISAGKNNTYGHPHDEALNRLTNAGVQNIYTTIGGNVILKTRGTEYTIEAGQVITPEPTPVPKPEETTPSPGDDGNGYPININTADHETLQEITGVGPVIATRIIEYRNAHGGFKTISEIKNVSGIGNARYDKMKDQITVS